MCMSLLLLTPAVFIGITFFGHVAHWSLHQPWMGRLTTSHMAHHQKLYPPTDMLSDKYRSAGKDSTVWIFAGLSIPVLAVPVVAWLFGLVSLFTAAYVIGEMILLGWLHDYVHDSFHIRGHWLRKVPFLNKLHTHFEKLHFVHHVDMSKNFGIFFSAWDKLFKTFKSE